MSRPCSAPRYPTPCIWRVLVKPSVTPVTAFCIRDRISPCIALSFGASEARSTTMSPSSCLTSTPRPTGTLSSPFGPLTLTVRSETSTSTLSGTSIGALPILDINHNPLVHEAKDLATDTGAAGFVIGEDAPRGREYRHPKSVEDAGDAGLLAVDAPAGPAYPSEACDSASLVGTVLELDDEPLLRARPPL